MKLIEFNAYKSSERNASSKAKNDVSSILKSLGFKDLYTPSRHRMIRILQQLWSIIVIPSDTILFIQYQSHIPLIYKLLSFKKKVKKIAILHDVESLRGSIAAENEIELLNSFDVIIDHNERMHKYLVNNGLKTFIQDIHIFDYLLDKKITIHANYDKHSIFFAGNLSKSVFLQHLADLNNLHFNIYGATFEGINKIIEQQNITYKGSFSPDELISNIEGGWGLVWDGNDLSTCFGINGEYMRYNNPHKVSLCVVSERPVIIWSHAAMADYINSRGIGICVDNLSDLYDKIKSIDDTEYANMLQNVKAEKERLINGQNLKDCMKKAENQLGIKIEY